MKVTGDVPILAVGRSVVWHRLGIVWRDGRRYILLADPDDPSRPARDGQRDNRLVAIDDERDVVTVIGVDTAWVREACVCVREGASPGGDLLRIPPCDAIYVGGAWRTARPMEDEVPDGVILAMYGPGRPLTLWMTADDAAWGPLAMSPCDGDWLVQLLDGSVIRLPDPVGSGADTNRPARG